ncbi:hypothetical protein P8625_10510 [Tenacibaculum tangerinum]|uniref:Transporter n=1 Tax=Tenacibaculum tangerinum TaxID=3038772 RepID=A0ABY8KZT3_9FLAO|nr:hypothetical protein [Tenacibaculum tangerinum]WGH74526.1 hypothetical protein P8625_10510 [Tenacibaculum tangerinum]
MKHLVLTALFLSTLTAFSQSPWTKSKNEAYIQASFTTIGSYDKIFGNPDYEPQREITDNTLQLYAEYGVTNNTTLFANIPLKMVKTGDFTQDMSAIFPSFTIDEASETLLGNIQLGVKHNFSKNTWLLTGQLSVEANTSTYKGNSGIRSGYDAWTFTPLFLTGRGFDSWYIQAFTGFDIRTNGYSSNYKLGGEVGYKALDWLWLAGFLDGVASLKNGEVVLPQENLATALYVNDQSYAAFGFKFIGEFTDNFGVNLGFGGALSGRNVAKAPALSFGLYHKF